MNIDGNDLNTLPNESLERKNNEDVEFGILMVQDVSSPQLQNETEPPEIKMKIRKSVDLLGMEN